MTLLLCSGKCLVVLIHVGTSFKFIRNLQPKLSIKCSLDSRWADPSPVPFCMPDMTPSFLLINLLKLGVHNVFVVFLFRVFLCSPAAIGPTGTRRVGRGLFIHMLREFV